MTQVDDVLTVESKKDILPIVEIPSAPKPEPLTKKQIGQMRRQYLTRVLPDVVACGHKFNPERPPVTKCLDCWTAFFKNSADIERLHKALTEDGIKSMRRTYGDRYVQMFSRFIQDQLTQFRAERQNGISKETEGRTEGEGADSSPSIGNGEIQNSVFSGQAIGQGTFDGKQLSAVGEPCGCSGATCQHQPALS